MAETARDRDPGSSRASERDGERDIPSGAGSEVSLSDAPLTTIVELLEQIHEKTLGEHPAELVEMLIERGLVERLDPPQAARHMQNRERLTEYDARREEIRAPLEELRGDISTLLLDLFEGRRYRTLDDRGVQRKRGEREELAEQVDRIHERTNALDKEYAPLLESRKLLSSYAETPEGFLRLTADGGDVLEGLRVRVDLAPQETLGEYDAGLAEVAQKLRESFARTRRAWTGLRLEEFKKDSSESLDLAFEIGAHGGDPAALTYEAKLLDNFLQTDEIKLENLADRAPVIGKLVVREVERDDERNEKYRELYGMMQRAGYSAGGETALWTTYLLDFPDEQAREKIIRLETLREEVQSLSKEIDENRSARRYVTVRLGQIDSEDLEGLAKQHLAIARKLEKAGAPNFWSAALGAVEFVGLGDDQVERGIARAKRIAEGIRRNEQKAPSQSEWVTGCILAGEPGSARQISENYNELKAELKRRNYNDSGARTLVLFTGTFHPLIWPPSQT